jgi:hypothetical protein
MFCEATNPERNVWVDAEYSASSRYDVYANYLQDVTRRLRARLQLPFESAVRTALDRVGRAFWDANARSLPLQVIQDAVADDAMLLEAISEGLLIRTPSDAGEEVAYAYDALGGYLIARSVLPAADEMAAWAAADDTRRRLGDEPPSDLHPLYEDISRAAVHSAYASGRDPTAWDVGPSWLKAALGGLVEAPAPRIPTAAVERLATHWMSLGSLRETVLEHVSDLATADHPLNADVLTALLAPLSLRDRDLTWTEWVRSRRDVLPEDIEYWESLLEDESVTDAVHQRRAHFVGWLLTTTDNDTRDRATRFLYEWGKRKPSALLELAQEVAGITDVYVAERVTAALYGVAMARYWEPGFAAMLRAMGQSMSQLYLSDHATAATTHLLLRSYAMWIAYLAAQYADLEGQLPDPEIQFEHPRPGWARIDEDDPRAEELETAIRMDFARYTVGRMAADEWEVGGQPARQDLLAEIRWRILDLGYRADDFKDIDREISDMSYGDRQEGRLERYGKKYSRIAFYELAGRLQDEGRLRRVQYGRISDVDIDPSFPARASRLTVDLPDWLSPEAVSDLEWLESAATDIPASLIWRPEIDGEEGPWLLVDGYVVEPNDGGRRRLYLNVSMIAHAAIDEEAIQAALATAPFPGDAYEQLGGTEHYLYAGEIPWSPLFGSREDATNTAPQMLEVTVRGDTVVEYEALSATYGWESYHSVENQAGGAVVPSSALCAAVGAFNRPQTFDMFGPDGRRLSVTRRPPGERDGHLLYVRLDVLRDYLAQRGLQGAVFAWGERQLMPTDGLRWTDEERAAIERDANVFRRLWMPNDDRLPASP